MGSDEYQNRITEFCFRSSFHHDPLTPPTTEFVGDIFRSGSPDWWEPWMRAVDELREDDELFNGM